MSRNLPTFPSLAHSSLRSVKVLGMNLESNYKLEILLRSTDNLRPQMVREK